MVQQELLYEEPVHVEILRVHFLNQVLARLENEADNLYYAGQVVGIKLLFGESGVVKSLGAFVKVVFESRCQDLCG